MRKNGPGDFTLLVASVDKKIGPTVAISTLAGLDNAKLTVEYGDFSKSLANVVKYLKEVSHHSELALKSFIRPPGREIHRQRSSGRRDQKIH